MIVNLNCQCKVYLNDMGKKIWFSQLEAIDPELAQAHPEIAETIKSMVKDDDSLSAELWTIMDVFGPYISMVTCPFKSTTIELNKNPDFGNYFTTINNEQEVHNNDE